MARGQGPEWVGLSHPPQPKFFIDNNLTKDMATLLREAGCVAEHAAELSKRTPERGSHRQGPMRWDDNVLIPYLHDHDFVIITNNGDEWKKLLVRKDHPGLIIVPNPSLEGSIEFLILALDAIFDQPEAVGNFMINRIVEVSPNGDVDLNA
jgi:hypothetical protein